MRLIINNIVKKIENKVILKNLSFSFDFSKIIAITGPSGVGKSTFLRLVSGLITPDSGECFLYDENINRQTPLNHRDVGLVFQQFHLFSHWTVLENLVFPQVLVKKKNIAVATKEAQAILERYHLAELKNQLVHKLSGGQKQRLAIGRAIMMNPKILCLDEPFSALDEGLVEHIVTILKQLRDEGYLVILTTHNLDVLVSLEAEVYCFDQEGIQKRRD